MAFALAQVPIWAIYEIARCPKEGLIKVFEILQGWSKESLKTNDFHQRNIITLIRQSWY